VSRHYLVDGYNLLYALPDIPPGPWPAKREAFLRLLESARPQGNNRLTVVFDSREGLGDEMRRGSLEVVFTAGETADEWIIRKVREAPNSRILAVVTDDQTLRRMIRGTGAQWLPTREFLKLERRPSKRQGAMIDQDTRLAQDITDEFKKKWL
jgi:predicted RNA-binding protein with PIN domain